MPRPRRCRRVCCEPGYLMFKPQGIPTTDLHKVDLGLDELEAVRLADVLDLPQIEAAVQMDVSQPTYNRILKSAREKVAKAIVEGCALRIQKGEQNEAIKISSERSVGQ
ncbi:MAG: DUF134 domain-containing protein [Candidatus Thermoplasmatota archaeon]|nr:DUF134 domain-containing protein [Candidatus Thermoplasmatota archaeon]